MVSPVVLHTKMLLQELCREKLHWDDIIPPYLAQRWREWAKGLHLLSGFEMLRCLKPEDFGIVVYAQLNQFCHASEDGYGVVTYLLLHICSHRVHCSFVLGKARVAPLNFTTIPLLEPTAATMAVCQDQMLRRQLQLTLQRVFYSSILDRQHSTAEHS